MGGVISLTMFDYDKNLKTIEWPLSKQLPHCQNQATSVPQSPNLPPPPQKKKKMIRFNNKITVFFQYNYLSVINK